MTGFLLRAVALMGIYLLVLTSLDPGDVLVGGLLGLALSAALRPRGAARGAGPSLSLAVAAASALGRTAAEMVVGSWRVVRFCLGAPTAPGFVEVPREDRTGHEVAMWGVLTGEAPDEVVVDVDRRSGMLVVHLVDAADPEGVRARHHAAHERWRTRVAR